MFFVVIVFILIESDSWPTWHFLWAFFLCKFLLLFLFFLSDKMSVTHFSFLWRKYCREVFMNLFSRPWCLTDFIEIFESIFYSASMVLQEPTHDWSWRYPRFLTWRSDTPKGSPCALVLIPPTLIDHDFWSSLCFRGGSLGYIQYLWSASSNYRGFPGGSVIKPPAFASTIGLLIHTQRSSNILYVDINLFKYVCRQYFLYLYTKYCLFWNPCKGMTAHISLLNVEITLTSISITSAISWSHALNWPENKPLSCIENVFE